MSNLDCIYNNFTKTFAYGSILASASLGAIIGWRWGSQDSIVLGTIFAGAAVCAEIIKPTAIKKIFQGENILPALCVAATCISFNLYNELSLSASSRSDAIAKRSLSAAEAHTQNAARTDAIEHLRLLPVTRLQATVQTDIDALRAEKRLGDCVRYATDFQRLNCPKLKELEQEKQDSKERARLQNIIDTTLYSTEIETDPVANELSMFLSIIGYDIKPTSISPWFSLLLPLMLETVSTFSLVLVKDATPKTTYQPKIEITPPPIQPVKQSKTFVHVKTSSPQIEAQLSRVLKVGFEGTVTDLATELNYDTAELYPLLEHKKYQAITKYTRLNNRIVYIKS